MLKMTHLSKAYRTEVVETYALRDFSINVREGEFVAVTGPSGSGKTTFLSIAGLLEEFNGGEYQLDGTRSDHLCQGKITGLTPMLDAPRSEQKDYRTIDEADGRIGEWNDGADGARDRESGEQNTIDEVAECNGQIHLSAEAAFRH